LHRQFACCTCCALSEAVPCWLLVVCLRLTHSLHSPRLCCICVMVS
jgi:hypothetical protein